MEKERIEHIFLKCNKVNTDEIKNSCEEHVLEYNCKNIVINPILKVVVEKFLKKYY